MRLEHNVNTFRAAGLNPQRLFLAAGIALISLVIFGVATLVWDRLVERPHSAETTKLVSEIASTAHAVRLYVDNPLPGNAAVSLVSQSCGCLDVRLPTKQITRGERAVIEVTPPNYIASTTLDIRLLLRFTAGQSLADIERFHRYRVLADVELREFSPVVSAAALEEGKWAFRVVTRRRTDGTQLKVAEPCVSFENGASLLKANSPVIESRGIVDGNIEETVWKVTVGARVAASTLPDIDGSLAVSCGPGVAIRPAPFRVLRQKVIEVAPERLALKAVKGTASLATVLVVNNDRRAYRILTVSGAKLKEIPKEPRTLHRLELTCVPASKAVRISTDWPGYTEIEIPITWKE